MIRDFFVCVSFFCFILVWITGVSAKEDYSGLGDSIISHYETELFAGSGTNWFVQQHHNGIIFLSNSNGLHSFDGANWRSYALNAQHLGNIRQFRIHSDGRIYVGGESDFGYFEPIANGDLKYSSLLYLLPKDNQLISNVNNVFIFEEQIYFITPELIIAYTPGQDLKTWSPKVRFSRGWLTGERLFFTDGSELSYLENNRRYSTPFTNEKKIKSFGFVQYIDQGYLVGTYSQGIYLLKENELSMWMSENNPDSKLGLYNSIKINEYLIAVSSINGGVIFLDHQGEVVYRLNIQNGLNSNITLNLFLDNQQGLWLTQEGYLSRAQLPFELSVFSGNRHTFAKVRGFSKLDNTLFLSAVNGIKTIDSLGKMSAPPNTLTSTADIVKIRNKLLIAGASECQIFDPRTKVVEPLLKTASCRDVLVSQKFPEFLLIITERSVAYSIWKNNRWHLPEEIVQNNQISSELIEDEYGNIWSADSKGNLLRFWFDKIWKSELINVHFSPATPLIYDGNLVVATDDGFFYWDYTAETMRTKVGWFHQQFGKNADAPYLLYQDNHQRLWLASRETAGFFELDNGKPVRWNNYPVAASGMKNLRRVFDDNSVVWLGFDDGIVRFSPSNLLKDKSSARALISEIRQKDTNRALSVDSFASADAQLESLTDEDSIRAYFGLTSYLQSNENQYRYRLNDESWNEWSRENYVDLGRLSGGEYQLDMQAKDLKQNTHSATSKRFKIIPPWYLSNSAYLLYGLILFSLIWLISNFIAGLRIKNISKQKRLLEKEVAARTKTIQTQADKLEKLAEAKSRFFANVSHEFRTPLTLAIGPLKELLKVDRIDHPSDKKFLEIAIDNCRQMLNLVGQILDINRLESGEMLLTVNQFNLGEKLSSYLDRYRVLADERQVKIIAQNLDEPITVYFDQDHLDKIVNNLLSNAFKFSETGTKIELGISLDKDSNSVDILVKDEGIGIAEDDSQQIFERYFQGKKSSNLQPGTGIGLSMVKELLDLHSASIELDRSYTQGALFVVTLKLGNSHYEQKHFVDEQVSTTLVTDLNTQSNLIVDHVEITCDESERVELPTVLVVDDHQDLRFYIKTALQTNYNIIEAANGRLALDLVQAEQPDFIISDVMMPVMDGLQLTKYLKSDPELAHIPLLLLTAKSTKRETVEGLQKGADDYLSKPFDSSELIARIDAHLAQKKNIAASIYQSFKKEASSIRNGVLSNQKKNSFTEKFSSFVEENLTDPEFDVACMTKHMNIERSTLFRKVKTSFDCTPGIYLRNCRLQLSLRMLEQQSGTVSEIAYAVGFQSLSYFSRCFNEKFKMRPTQYLSKLN